MSRLLSIGEFSRISGLTIKALRFYHEQSLLIPERIDPGSGYRFYSPDQAETARLICGLRDLQFPVRQIREIIDQADDETDLLDALQQKRIAVSERIAADRETHRQLTQLISDIRKTRRLMNSQTFAIEQKSVPSIQIAALRMHAPYQQCGDGFKKLGRAFGRHICGKAMLLCYDEEYREVANYEVAMPVRGGASHDEFEVRELPACTCLSLVHKGPYDSLSRSYEKLVAHAKASGVTIERPTREVYLKGPGMIFRGNPDNYLTEIQMPIAATEDTSCS